MRKLVLVVLLMAISTVAFGQSESKTKAGGATEQQISKLMDEGREAALKGDATWLEKHVADNYTSISPAGLQTKTEVIDMRKSGQLKYDSIEVRDRNVRVLGDTAIARVRATVKGTRAGQDISGDYLVTAVWQRQGGAWKQVSWQSTKLMEGQPSR